jgi:hypothetical protein
VAERAGDFIFTCTGGQAGTADVRFFTNSSITSQIVEANSGGTETLLLVNEPATPVLGVNAFRGIYCTVNSNVLCWTGVPVSSGPITWRITNLRVDATSLWQSLGFISVTADRSIAINESQRAIGIVLPSQAFRPDFNFDSYIDLVWQDPVTGFATVWYLGVDTTNTIIGAMNPPDRGLTPIAVATLDAGNTWRIVGYGDFDGDQHPDVVWQDPASGAAQVRISGGPKGTVTQRVVTLSNGNAWRIRSIADFNRDGKPDVVWQDPASGAAQIWFMGGTDASTVTGAANLSAGSTWRIAGAADFNRDDQPDVVWQDPATGAAQVWYLGGTQGNVTTGAAGLSGGNTWRIAAVADFNFDGHSDVIWQDPITGASSFWLLGGTGGTDIQRSVGLTAHNMWRIAGPR